ncbi:DUF2310 family Zn-ribbon-containing protein [Arsenicibacter rosenii]|uniref:DNA-binding protein n=1 Tax=Arsenicibacter rosenii TaxID=1750698 RepID=A0A1S2VGM4_9BACT|nr:DUF2310 family Zn-ribbon-containing protein [Arsenicibacter rosenii]OIN57874.1 DNA-binding protein [Arsenicibacter rosenii]
MYVQKVSLEIKSDAAIDEVVDAFIVLLNFYRGSGQKQGKIESQYVSGNTVTAYPFTLECDSLDKSHNNFYVNRQIEKLETICQSDVQITTIGKSHDDYTGPCTCHKPEFYILKTDYISIDSPVTCGSCNHRVPLYRLPVYEDHGYMPILSWETNYVSCDSLQMNCEVGEQWATRQMQDVRSQLSKQGITICHTIEQLTAIPTYYYLYNYRRRPNKVTQNHCPNCKQPWSLKKRLHRFYDFKCDFCRLISTVSLNT